MPMTSIITTLECFTPDGRTISMSDLLREFRNGIQSPESEPETESEPEPEPAQEDELVLTYSDDLLKFWESESCDKLEFNDGNYLWTWGCKCCLIVGNSDYNWITKHIPMIESKLGITYKRYCEIKDEDESLDDLNLECPYVFPLENLFNSMYVDGFKYPPENLT